ncbi:hypothetical protein IJI17_02105 [Candidatus Saccharibacteria bacterium]|nr:hypothetical protein [Fibrobacter sp.]MBQ6320992.1 hypothetical protein [Candidatus Saccharibacteria bacterium]
MAKPTIIVNGNTYSEAEGVDIPMQGGGTARFYYTGDATAAAADTLTGKTAYTAAGEVTGAMANNGATGGTISTKAGVVTIPAGYTTGGSVEISATEQAKVVAANIRQGVTLLGVAGSMTAPVISFDTQTHILSIS